MTKEELEALGDVLVRQQASMESRYNAFKTLRDTGGYDAFVQIARALRDPSVLLSHECAFAIGQMGIPEALPLLLEVVCDESLNVILRHEAVVGLGAIGSNQEDVVAVLRKYAKCEHPEVAETCEVALGRIEWLHDGRAQTEAPPPSRFPNIDAAPSYNTEDVDALCSILVDNERPVFDRYRAMYQLRNIGTPEAVNALAKGFKSKSVLLRHEIATVLGQLRTEGAVEFIYERTSDLSEHGMVRHECCEALAAIGTDRCYDILREFSEDKDEVVRDSCVAGLGMDHICLCLSK